MINEGDILDELKTDPFALIKENKSRIEKAIKYLSNSIIVVLVAIVALLIVSRFFGIKTFTIISSSMEPNYHVGSMIFVKSVNAADIKIGDTITFSSDSSLLPVTHRVSRIDLENQSFYTKGDANNSEDTFPANFSNLIGKPVVNIPFIGYIAVFLSTGLRKILALMVVVLLLLVQIFPNLIHWIKQGNKTDANKR